MCNVEEREQILQKPLLNYTDIMKILGCSSNIAYRYIEEIRIMMQEQGKPVPYQLRRVTSTAFRQYFEV